MFGFEGGDSMDKSMADHQEQDELPGLANFSAHKDVFSYLTENHYIKSDTFEVINIILSYKLELAIGIFADPDLTEEDKDHF